MIGQPLQKINHIPSADDYNKLIEVIRPYQNLQIGSGLNGYIKQHSSWNLLRYDNSIVFDKFQLKTYKLYLNNKNK